MGHPEARLAEMLTGFEAELPVNIKLAYLPSSGIIKLRLTGTGNNRNTVSEAIGMIRLKNFTILSLI